MEYVTQEGRLGFGTRVTEFSDATCTAGITNTKDWTV